jgi:tRNA-2-methylthio-N6-dimethylallyladenosine synthase
MQAKRFYLRTFGCQMNEYDSLLLTDLLISSGWSQTEDISRASLIVFNTCSVREKAETRVYGHLGGVAALKKSNPEVKVAVVGCMAQRLGESLIGQFPFVDLVLGTEEVFSLPDILESEEISDRVRLNLSGEDFGDLGRRLACSGPGKLSRFVAITRGCDNFCSYCIVPYLRGRLRCRPHLQILEEVEALVNRGAKEITLIGQNVNSYWDGEIDFPDLLQKVSEVPDLQRVRFITSHPKDFSAKLVERIASLPQVCEQLHLPLQSGSDRVLQRMNREYTIDEYVQKAQQARKRIPGLCLTTDLIVGFPGETEADFEKTLGVVEEVGFDSSFTFRYSPREGTPAARWVDDVPEEVKIRRLNRLIALQGEISSKRNRSLEGTVQEILVEGRSRRGEKEWKGKTRAGQSVLFSADSSDLQGELLQVRIDSSNRKTLFGEWVTSLELAGREEPASFE